MILPDCDILDTRTLELVVESKEAEEIKGRALPGKRAPRKGA
jgi:hypothetical protein